MKHIYKITSALLLLIIFITGCVQQPQNNELNIIGSGNVVSREDTIKGFNQVEAGLYFNLTIRQGEDFKVVVFSDDNFIEYIQVEKVEQTLVFDLKPGHAYDFSNVTLRAEVTLPELAGIRLSGSSHAALAGFNAQPNFEAELSGSSSLEGSLEAEYASFIQTGSTFINLAGKSENLWVDACGNSITDLRAFPSETAAMEVSCASRVMVNVNGKLDVDASQNASVAYSGQPVLGEINVNEYASLEAR